MTEVHSDWADWLPKAVADADPDGLACWYLGCNGLILKSAGGTTLFVDPYLGTGDPPRTVRMVPIPFDPADVAHADAILATHEHSDHVHGPSQAPILESTGATFHGPEPSVAVTETAEWQQQWSLDDSQIATVAVGDTLDFGDLTVNVEPANDPDAEESVAYVVEHETGTFVHGGDARPGAFESVGDSYDIDAGVLAFGSAGMIPDKETREPTYTKWYNDENQIIQAARELQLDTLVPTHWDMWKGLGADPTVLHRHANGFEYPRAINVVEVGDRFGV